LKRGDGWLLRAEASYVWGRQVLPLNGPTISPSDTVMLRLALIY
jgi:hypothetical protein